MEFALFLVATELQPKERDHDSWDGVKNDDRVIGVHVDSTGLD